MIPRPRLWRHGGAAALVLAMLLATPAAAGERYRADVHVSVQGKGWLRFFHHREQRTRGDYKSSIKQFEKYLKRGGGGGLAEKYKVKDKGLARPPKRGVIATSLASGFFDGMTIYSVLSQPASATAYMAGFAPADAMSGLMSYRAIKDYLHLRKERRLKMEGWLDREAHALTRAQFDAMPRDMQEAIIEIRGSEPPADR